MTDTKELPFWIALTNIPGTTLKTHKKNGIVIKCCHENRQPLSEFFSTDAEELSCVYGLTTQEIEAIHEAKTKLPNYSFLTEDLISQGYEILPIFDEDYPQSLKRNLKRNAPVLLYLKGNRDLLKKCCTAIVGARNAGETALAFTDRIAKKAITEGHPVVSGYAKGVDRQAFDSAIKYGGESIIVLPQGITTFNGFNKLYKYFLDNKILAVSIFHPSAQWSKGLAMGRNPIIYALAEEIYVAESNDKGGTWEGVIDGLKKGRKINVRMPEAGEKNANVILIEKGCTPISFQGNREIPAENENHSVQPCFADPGTNYGKCPLDESIEKQIIRMLRQTEMTLQDLKTILNIGWSDTRTRRFLNGLEGIKINKKGKAHLYTLIDQTEPKLF